MQFVGMAMRSAFPSFIGLVALALLGACSGSSVPPASSAASSTQTPQITLASLPHDTVADLPDIVSVVAKVKPSVVAINDQVVTTTRRGGTTTQAAAGSGWILDSNGLIVTNDHVVSGAQNIVISLDDGRIFKAIDVVSDPENDLAIVKVDAAGLPAARIGDSGR